MATILVIDDSPSALSLAEQILGEAGHRVISCLWAADAMKVLAETPVDILITDLYMPDKDGLELIQEAHKMRPDVPIIAVSGAAGVKNLLHAAKLLGAACTLRKPFTKEQLLNAVATVGTPPDRPGDRSPQLPKEAGNAC
jgi:DNA-binding NtrC family response regulator